MAAQKLRLTVERLDADDTYLDRVRLHKDLRGGIRVGQICRLSTPHGSAYVEAREMVCLVGVSDLSTNVAALSEASDHDVCEYRKHVEWRAASR